MIINKEEKSRETYSNRSRDVDIITTDILG